MESIRVKPTVCIPTPAVAFPLEKHTTAKGKYAHLSTSSEEFAGRKQEEIDLEERGRDLGNG